MKRPALALTLILVATSLSAQVSAEVPISPAQLMNGADHEQLSPEVATNGSLYLVVWQNRTPHEEIYAARVSGDGTLLEQTPIPIAVAPRVGERPHVVWTGELFIVTWMNVGEIRATKVSASGQVVGEELIGGGFDASMSCTAARCLMTWTIGAGPGMARVAAKFFDTRGNPLPEIPALPAFTGSNAWSTPNAANASSFLVTWQQFNANESPRIKLYTASVSPDGRVDNVQVIAGDNQALRQHAVASDGSGYFVTWALSDGSLNRIEGVKIDSAGKAMGGAKVLDSSGPVGGMVKLVRVSGGYLVFMNRSTDAPEGLFAFRMTAEGAVLDPAPALLTVGFSLNGGISAAANGTKVLVVFPRAASPSSRPDIYAAFVDSESGTMQQPFVVTRSAAVQVAPALATDGERVVAVWSESLPAPAQIRTAAFLPEGLPTAARTIHSSAREQVQPAVAFNGREYLVAWYESDAKVMTKRLNRFGEPIEGSEIVLSTNGCLLPGRRVAVASDGRDFVVAWQTCSSSPRQLLAARIADGVASAPRLVAESSSPLDLQEIAWGVNAYLLTWNEMKLFEGICDPVCFTPRLNAARLNPGAEILDSSPLRLSPTFNFPKASRVAWDGAYFAAFWWDGPFIYVTRVSPSGSVLAPVEVARTQQIPSALAVTSDGSSIGLTWSEPGSSGFGNIWISRIGSLTPSWSPFQVSDSADDELVPAVAAVGPGKFAIAYQRIAHEPQYGSANRVFVRIVSGCPVPKITAISPDREIVAGKIANLTVTAPGATAFQWYLGQSGTTTSPLPGMVASSVDVIPAATTTYWVRALSSCGYTDSATITVTVRPCQAPGIASQSGDALVVAGRSAELSVAATGTSISYQWYEGPLLDTSHPVAGGNGPKLITRPITASTQFWVRVTGQCGIVNSAVVNVRVLARRRVAGQ
jgi:hypothetical protein